MRPTLGCYGDQRAITPNLDSLAKMGTVFNKAYCQSAVCNPSRTSFLTGLRPDETGVVNLVSHFREKKTDIYTLPQIFKEYGYESFGVGKVFHGKKRTQDTLSWTIPSYKSIGIKSEQYYLKENKKFGKKASSWEMADVKDNEYLDGEFTDVAIQHLKNLSKSAKPFFLAVGFLKPHLPFTAPKKYFDLYDREKVYSPQFKGRPKEAPDLAFHNSEELRGYTDIPDLGEISVEKEKELWHAYYACVSYVDTQVGKIIKELKAHHLDNNTIIVVVGDHGYHLGEQGVWCKSTNYELAARVPLLIYCPWIESQSDNVEEIVELIDIYPTVTELCGIDSRHKLSGRSLKGLMKGNLEYKEDWNDVAFNQFIRPYESLFKVENEIENIGYSVRVKDYRYVGWFDEDTDILYEEELYHLDQGDHFIEKLNLAEDPMYREIAKILQKRILAYKKMNYLEAYGKVN